MSSNPFNNGEGPDKLKVDFTTTQGGFALEKYFEYYPWCRDVDHDTYVVLDLANPIARSAAGKYAMFPPLENEEFIERIPELLSRIQYLNNKENGEI